MTSQVKPNVTSFDPLQAFLNEVRTYIHAKFAFAFFAACDNLLNTLPKYEWLMAIYLFLCINIAIYI